jgi:hypothetical protein
VGVGKVVKALWVESVAGSVKMLELQYEWGSAYVYLHVVEFAVRMG